MDEHLAGCETCYEVFAETARFALDDSDSETAPGSPSGRIAFFRRPGFRMVAGLAAAAGVFVALHQVWRARSERDRPLVAELAEAVSTRRFVEPRLTGGFQHGRLVVLRSDATQGLDAQSPAVIAAVARIRARAESDPSAEALGALGITYLVSGDMSGAVRALESATAQDPQSARLSSDLAAAYLVRASRLDEPADLPKALEAAEKATELPSPPDEAWFNRALALEGLHLTDAARKAWEDYLKRDATSAWADEARRHLEQLPRERQSSIEEDRGRVRAALDEGAGAVDRIARDEPSLLRGYFQDELLPAWAVAHLEGRSDAGRLRDEAQLVGDALLRATGDALPHETARALGSVTAASRLRSQAVGLQALQAAQRLYDRLEPSCAVNRAALRDLEAGGSPRAAWARLQVVITCLFAKDQKAAVAELARSRRLPRPAATPNSWAACAGCRGSSCVESGDLDALARAAIGSPGLAFVEIREHESEAATLALIARTFVASAKVGAPGGSECGPLPCSASCATRTAARPSWTRPFTRASPSRRPAAASTSRTRWWRPPGSGRPPTRPARPLMRRAQLRHALGSHALAAADLQESLRLVAQVADPVLKQRLAAQAQATSGEILGRTEPEAAAGSLRESLAHFKVTAPQRLPALELLLARALLSPGPDRRGRARAPGRNRGAGATADLASGRPPAGLLLRPGGAALRRHGAHQGRPRRRGGRPGLRRTGAVSTAPGCAAARRRFRHRRHGFRARRHSRSAGAAGRAGRGSDAALLRGPRRPPADLERHRGAGSSSSRVPCRRRDCASSWPATGAALERQSAPEAARQTGAALHDELVRPVLPALAHSKDAHHRP